MPRTSIPIRLIHDPKEVEQNAERFDQLCRLAEEAAFPVVRAALRRETIATGADVLVSEAREALEVLADGAAILEGLDQRQLLDDVRESLNKAMLPPEEEECRTHTREVVQVMMSTWLEVLQQCLKKAEAVVLRSLVPHVKIGVVTKVLGHLRSAKPSVRGLLTEALSSFAIDDKDLDAIMMTLDAKLFATPRVVELPFNLVMAGAPEMPVFAMNRSVLERCLDDVREDRIPAATRKRAAAIQPVIVRETTHAFVTPHARAALTSLCEPLSPVQYASLSDVASPQFTLMNIPGFQGFSAAAIWRS